jgi:hypothetical protein
VLLSVTSWESNVTERHAAKNEIPNNRGLIASALINYKNDVHK